MNYNQDKFVRFQDWRSPKSNEDQFSARDGGGFQSSRKTTLLYSVTDKFQRLLEPGSERISKLTRSLRRACFFGSFSAVEDRDWRQKILDPQGSFLQKWNRLVLLSCVFAVYLDSMFLYNSVIDDDKKCLGRDKKLEVAAIVLRSLNDIFYIFHIIFRFRTGFVAPSSRIYGRGVLVKDGWAIAKRYVFPYFFIDIFAVLPLPQVVIFFVNPNMGGSASLNRRTLLTFIVFFQYFPRLLRIYPLYKEVTRLSGLITETAWAGAVLNLVLYMVASHVIGAFWYVFSIERGTICWIEACRRDTQCVDSWLYCDDNIRFKQVLNGSCPINTPYPSFGIFTDALQSGVVESTNFRKKSLYCFWWGLQNLSSLGQNLKATTNDQEICFAVFISVSGLVLFSFLIGNMQTFLQSTTQRLEEMRVKRRDAEQWMSHRLLPENLRSRIRRYQQYKWQETRGVDEESVICNLPKDLRRDIKRHLCLDLLMRVPMFEKMDDKLLDALCHCLKPILYTEDSFIVREGDPVDEMFFIMGGKLLTVTTDGGRTGFFNSVYLKPGDFCGEELLTWALDPNSSANLPISTRTVQALSEVEGFVLRADDLKFVASQFRRLHSKQLRHTFRFYSQHWRTWAACFIQAAWRRHCRKKLERTLREEEERLQDALLAREGGSSPSLGATIYASRFAANALRALRNNGARRATERVPPKLLRKPSEPDFASET